MTTEATAQTTYDPCLGDVVGITDDDGIERVGRIVVHSMNEPDPLPWLVAFPHDVDEWMDDYVQRHWLPSDRLRLINRTVTDPAS